MHLCDLHWQAQDRVEYPSADRFVERAANANQEAAANQVQYSLHDIKAAGEDCDADERRHAAAGQHTIVDFEHEHRAGEHENVAHAADQTSREECAATGCQRGPEFRMLWIDRAFDLAWRHGSDHKPMKLP